MSVFRSLAHLRYQKNTIWALGLVVVIIGATALIASRQRGGTSVQPRAPRDDSFQQGISYAAWWSGQYSTPGADLSLERLAATGADWIALIVTGHQDTPASTTINFDDESVPTDADLVHVIDHAHRLGLKVMLKPHLDLRNEMVNGLWRGDIGTAFTTEAEWSAWFASYKDFIEHYARLAETHGADQFCVGTELLGTSHRDADWRSIVAGVREIYSGPIVYAALRGGEETWVTWWDAVDYIGIDGYYSLCADPEHDLTVEELEAAWEGPKALLERISRTYGKPILLTELGYRSQDGCTSDPWDWWTEGPVDLEEQARAYEAAFRQFYDEPWVGGMFWWAWVPDRFESGPCDGSFSPHLKPAEDVLRAWYGGPPRPSQPALSADYDRTMDIYTDGLAADWRNASWEAMVDTAAQDRVYSGSQSIAVTPGPWGALSLLHPAFRADPYQWLEFYVRGSSSNELALQVFFETQDGTKLPLAPVNDCRHVEGGTIDPGTWKRVRIPLDDLNVPGHDVTRISIQNNSWDAAERFWIDEIRLVAAVEAGSTAVSGSDDSESPEDRLFGSIKVLLHQVLSW